MGTNVGYFFQTFIYIHIYIFVYQKGATTYSQCHVHEYLVYCHLYEVNCDLLVSFFI